MNLDGDPANSVVSSTAAATPPTQPGAVVAYEATTMWPKLLGMPGVIIGVVVFMGALWDVVSPFLWEDWFRHFAYEEEVWHWRSLTWRAVMIATSLA